ncbi:unnamed protein product [Sphenostylis stenocarpa]|uniref:Uncharacterized protein n=1 Tax=Sphenostylis stenocarpa TaxID=92480 RepID=A0AA86RRI1_9FABA|nr:unnamed protein product [Sphenostylis stenocarpa]
MDGEVTQMGRKKESLVAQNSRRGLKGRLRGRCCAEEEQINTETYVEAVEPMRDWRSTSTSVTGPDTDEIGNMENIGGCLCDLVHGKTARRHQSHMKDMKISFASHILYCSCDGFGNVLSNSVGGVSFYRGTSCDDKDKE